MKFYFQGMNKDDKSCLAMEFDALRWDEALDQFVKFLRGCGYSLDNDSVGVNRDKHMFICDDEHLGNITDFTKEGDI